MLIDHDPHVLPAHRLAAMLEGAPWRRLVAIGDSVAEGVREPHERFRDLSWIDRVAEAIEAAAPGLVQRNLGRRGLRAAEIRAQQLDAALAFEPDLAIVAAGGNDLLSATTGFDAAAVERHVDAMVRSLRDAGADVLTTGLLDISRSGLVAARWAGELSARLHALDEVLRTVARRHGAVHLSLVDHPAAALCDIYASDRLHLNARGHAIVGSEAVRALARIVPVRQARAA